MQIRHDPDSDALKIKFSKREYAHSQMITNNCILDFDADGNVIGVELLNVSKHVDDPKPSYVDITKETEKP